ncbi:MAG: hypothetical protein K6T72_07770 [Anoxybacillus sp.]|nr:hypothetical protein [Anoxybacillus sp.]MCL6586395.1 hypothetical protein [Anoxybacillus sp.]
MQPQIMSQQTVMSQPPQVISTKDALYLTDMMSWNLLAMKKAHFFASQCQDEEIVAAIERAGQMHQRHYERLLQHLQQNQPTIPLQ